MVRATNNLLDSLGSLAVEVRSFLTNTQRGDPPLSLGATGFNLAALSPRQSLCSDKDLNASRQQVGPHVSR